MVTAIPANRHLLARLVGMVVLASLPIAYATLLLGVGNDPTGWISFQLLCLVQLTPMIYCLATRRLNLIALLGLAHFAYYSCGKYNQVFGVEQQEAFDFISIRVFHALCTCYVLLFGAYITIRGFFLPRAQDQRMQPCFQIEPRLLLFFSATCCFLPFVISYLPGAMQSASGPGLSALMALVLTAKCRSRHAAFYAKLAIMIYPVVSFLHFGSLGTMLEVGIDLVIINVWARNVRNLILLSLGILVGAALQMVKGEYRNVVWKQDNVSWEERVDLMYALIEQQYFGAPRDLASVDEEDAEKDDTQDMLQHAFTRIGDDSLEKVFDMTPREVPYWNGSTYEATLFAFVPRALWPNKPPRTLWHDFAVKYQYLSDNDDSTSISLSYFAEAFMNFGMFGLYAVSIFMGAFVGLVAWFSERLLGGFNLFVLVFLAPYVTGYAQDLGSIVLGVIMCVMLLLYFRSRLQSLLLPIQAEA